MASKPDPLPFSKQMAPIMAVLTPTAKTMEVGLRVNADNINQIP
jgi:hypothetical protein